MIQKLQHQLKVAEQKNTELEVEKNKAVAQVERLKSQNQICEEQLAQEQKNSQSVMSKYQTLKDEFKKMKHKYERELTTCVQEIENLRVIVIDVVS